MEISRNKIISELKKNQSGYTISELSKKLKLSDRGELEITDLNNLYLTNNALKVYIYNGYWLDTGTFDSLLEASNKIANLK